MSGVVLNEALRKDPQVIFSSAQATYTAKAFEIDATECIQKPLSFKSFLDAVQKAKRREAKQEVLE